MALVDFHTVAAGLPVTWESTLLGVAGGSRIKVLRMDAGCYPEEVHDCNEALIVISGKLMLQVDGKVIEVGEGQMYLAQAGVAHAVVSGSHGTLVIVDA